jgi:hypothetical protein
MVIKTFQNTYNAIEFDHYISPTTDGDCISIIEVLIETDNTDSIEHDFSQIFAVEAKTQTYVFSNYTVSEFYVIREGIVKVICVK